MMVLFRFTAEQAAVVIPIITAVVQGLKNVADWLRAHATPGTFWEKLWNFFAGSWGPRVLAGALAVVALLPGIAADEAFTLSELLQVIGAATGLTLGAVGLFDLLKKLRAKK